jgi:hypothetical protein
MLIDADAYPLDASEENMTSRGRQASRICSQSNGEGRVRQQIRLGQDSVPMREEVVEVDY